MPKRLDVMAAVLLAVALVVPADASLARPSSVGGVPAKAAATEAASWHRENLPTPTYHGGQLVDVDCVKRSRCAALGFRYGIDNVARYFVEFLRGNSWQVTNVPTPDGAKYVAIDCTSLRFCVAVGSGPVRSVAARWNGRSWRAAWLHRSSRRIKTAELSSVSCSSRVACTAVGEQWLSHTGIFRSTFLVERWNGHRWSVQRAARVKRHRAAFNGVSCPGRSTCFAVGGQWIERWNGSMWRMDERVDSFLSGIDCVSATRCVIVGGGGRPDSR